MSGLAVTAALLAGIVGAVVRYLVARAFAGHPTRLPWAVLIVNTAGSFAAGIGVALPPMIDAGPWLQLILVSGFAGGLTTFSTFSTETVQLFFARRGKAAVASVVANLVLGLAAFLLGCGAVLAIAIATAERFILA